MLSKLDELLAQLGTGWWDVIHYVVLFFCLSLPTPHAFGGAFLAPNVDYTCIEPSESETSQKINTEILQFAASPTSSYNSILQNDQCTFLVRNETTGDSTEEICSQWHFDNSTFTATVTSEFELTCDRAYLRATYQSIYMSGMFIGALLSGFAADRYGRKTTLIFGLVFFIAITNFSCLSPNLSVLLFFRFLVGVTVPFIANTSYILVVEISEPRLRPHLGIISMLPWAFSTMIWGGIASLIRRWRWLQFTVSIPGVLVLPFLWLMDESPRWLAVTGRHGQALRVLSKAARLNRTVLPSEEEIGGILRDCNREFQKEPPKKEMKTRSLKTILRENFSKMNILFRTPRLRKITIALYTSYLLVNMVYYGLSLSGGNLSDSPFVYMVLTGLMEVPAYSLTVPIVARFGRKMPTLVSFGLAGLTLLAIAPTPSSCGWLVIALAMVGKLAITSAYQILIFYSTELFPTEVRSRGIGTSFMMSRIGSILSPFINEILGSAYSWAPAAVFGVTSIIACLVMLTLPETLGKALPDTVADFEAGASPRLQEGSWLPLPTSEKPPAPK